MTTEWQPMPSARDDDDTPREERSPITEVLIVLADAHMLYERRYPEPPCPEGFVMRIFNDMIDQQERIVYGDEAYAEVGMLSELGNTIDEWSKWTVGRIVVTVAYCVECIRNFASGEIGAAWTLVIDARDVLNEALLFEESRFGMMETQASESNKRTAIAKVASAARHVENHDSKQQAIDYFIANRDTFKSKEAAAEAIAGKVVPFPFKTVRRWLNNV